MAKRKLGRLGDVSVDEDEATEATPGAAEHHEKVEIPPHVGAHRTTTPDASVPEALD